MLKITEHLPPDQRKHIQSTLTISFWITEDNGSHSVIFSFSLLYRDYAKVNHGTWRVLPTEGETHVLVSLLKPRRQAAEGSNLTGLCSSARWPPSHLTTHVQLGSDSITQLHSHHGGRGRRREEGVLWCASWDAAVRGTEKCPMRCRASDVKGGTSGLSSSYDPAIHQPPQENWDNRVVVKWHRKKQV